MAKSKKQATRKRLNDVEVLQALKDHAWSRSLAAKALKVADSVIYGRVKTLKELGVEIPDAELHMNSYNRTDEDIAALKALVAGQ